VELIKSTRKILKQKIRGVVDKVGPKLYKNFDKMRLVMREPGSKMRRRTASVHTGLGGNNIPKENLRPVNEEINNVGNSELGDHLFPQSRMSSRRGSFEAVTDYDLPYLDELEINRAFNVFDKNINL